MAERNSRASLDNAHARIFGISSYLNVPQLPAGLRLGAQQLAEVLTDPDLGGYRSDQVRLMVDSQVTRQKVLDELSWLRSETDSESTIFLFFAGHGGQLASGEARLLPVEVDNSSPERLAGTTIPETELAEALMAIPARRLLLVFDCCHAGGLVAQLSELVAGLPDRYCQSLATRGRVVLASARPDEKSWVPTDGGPSLFTKHFLAGLRGAARGKDGWLRAVDLFEYLQPRVTADHPKQHPIFKAELEEHFPVAKAQGGQALDSDGPDDRFHAYLSYADQEPDATFVWQYLVPRLEAAGLRIAVSGDVEDPGVYRVVGVERAIVRARRTIAVLSEIYLRDHMAGFIDAMAQTRGLEEGFARLIPIRFGNLPKELLPTRLRMLVGLDLSPSVRAQRNFNRLVRTLHEPAPKEKEIFEGFA